MMITRGQTEIAGESAGDLTASKVELIRPRFDSLGKQNPVNLYGGILGVVGQVFFQLGHWEAGAK